MFVYCECCVLSGRGLCDELITRPEGSYRLWCVVVCDLETARMGAQYIYIYIYIYIYDISSLRVKSGGLNLLQPPGHVQVCTGFALPLPLPLPLITEVNCVLRLRGSSDLYSRPIGNFFNCGAKTAGE